MRRPCSQVLGVLAQPVDLYTLLVATIPIATFFVYLKLTTFGPDPKKGFRQDRRVYMYRTEKVEICHHPNQSPIRKLPSVGQIYLAFTLEKTSATLRPIIYRPKVY